jgi:hypothetical protein
MGQLLMLRNDNAGAAAILGALPTKGTSARYVRYNLGIALLKSGNTKRGTELLDEIGKEGAPSEEYRNLRDRANVALGFSALAENRPKDARTYLERVRLESLQSSKALLGYGWAADALKDPQLALVPWQELAKARLRRDRGARGADRGALCVRRARRPWPGAAALRGRDRRVRARERRDRGVDQGDPQRQDDRHPRRAEPRRRDGLVLEDPRPRRDAAGAPSRADPGAARVPGGAEELPRPALPLAQPRGLARQARHLRRHAGDAAERPSPTGCRSFASASSRSTSRRS